MQLLTAVQDHGLGYPHAEITRIEGIAREIESEMPHATLTFNVRTWFGFCRLRNSRWAYL
jgi:hypothetical protein